MFSLDLYYSILGAMGCLAAVVFFVLLRVAPGYGITYDGKWGPTLPNRVGWVLMEAPSFIAMSLIWLLSERRWEPAPMVMCLLFLVHYFQRSFIFPFLMKGKSRMPVLIMTLGIVFNLINTYLIGGWLFWVSPEGEYPVSWLYSPLFILGAVIFIAGMAINLNSDHIIRNLRRPGDTKHYIPRGGMFRYVTSANYLGEFTEWVGYAILTWSLPGAVFALWTFANLAPRARATHRRYLREFGDEYGRLRRRYILPFIY